jgi:hypothetical protein
LKHFYRGKCRSNQKCSTCYGWHHTLLHETKAEESKNIERKTKSTNAVVKDKIDEEVLLATAIIKFTSDDDNRSSGTKTVLKEIKNRNGTHRHVQLIKLNKRL